MRMKKNWLKTTIAMITLVATVIETGFSSVTTFAAELASDDGLVVDIDPNEEVLTDDASPVDELQDDVLTDQGSEENDDLLEGAGAEDDAAAGDIMEQKAGALDVSAKGISGSGYGNISIYIDTANLAASDKFSVKFTGPGSAVYNPVLNDDLDKTDGGRYDFDNLGGSDFSIRAFSDNDVIFSYEYNADGYPEIVVQSGSSDRILTTKVLTAADDTKISAVSGKGYESITVKFDTADLSDKDSFKFYVESEAFAKVDGKSAIDGIGGLTKADKSVVVEDLEGESFVAYAVAEDGSELETIAEITSVEDGAAVIDINGVDTKRVYEYEDSKVYVRATLEEADAVPDDAYFGVAPLSEEDAEKYLEVLNSNKAEDEQEYTAENTLLYDIGFYTDETKAEEIEPEEGTVSLSVEFKANQVSEDLGITDKGNIEVTHFVEEGSKIETETLPVSQTGDVDTVEVETESFSKFAFTGKRDNTVEVDVNTAGAESSKGLLGEAWLYGITANTWKFNGEAETNFAVKTLTGKNGPLNGGQTGVNSSKAQGSTYQYGIVSYVDGSTRIKGFPIELVIPESEIRKITHESGASNISIITAAKSDIDNTIDGMITYVKGGTGVQGSSVRLSRLDSVKSYNNLPNGDDAGKLTIDISKATSGTYYINVDKYEALKRAFTISEGVTIIKKSDQKLVFNFGGEYVELNKFKIVQGNETYVSDTLANMSTGINPIVEDMIVNMYNAKTAKICNFAGILLAPKATVEFGGVDGGWLVCDTAISDAEWHFVNGHIPTPKPGKTSIEIPVNKKFIGGSGYWKDDFTFKLVKLSSDGKQVDNSFSPRYITLNGGDSEDASGKFVLNFDNVDSLTFGPNYSGFYTNFTECHEEWYRVSEENIGKRSDVEYNLYDASDNYGANSPYWFVHVFIYRLSYDHSQVRAVFRTARKDPKTYDWGLGIPCKESQPVFFKNKYKPVETEVELRGIKKINGSDKDIPDGKFAFSLYQYTNRYTGFSNAIQADVYNRGNEIRFAPMTLKLGTGTQNEPSKENATKSIWYFLIKETQCAEPYKMDETQFIAKVTVENINNTLVQTVQYFRFEKGKAIDVTRAMENDPAFEFNCGSKFKFNNTYDATGSAKIYGFKTLEGRDLEPDDEFTFTLSSSDDKQANANQRKTFKVSQVTSDGFNFVFDELSYSLSDNGKTYHYIVKEEAGSAPGMSYDSSSKPITITITDGGNGQLDIDQNDGTDAHPVKFTNRYKANSNVVFKARKEYPEVTELSRKATFTFRLTGSREDGYKSVDEEKSVQGPGEVEFSEILFNKAKDAASGTTVDETGTYHYSIKEVVPDDAKDVEGVPHKKIKDGIIYDDRTYNITLVVTDDKSGELKKSMTGGYDDEEQVSITEVCPGFINDYKLNPAKDPVNGKKSFPGEVLKRGMFTFELSAFDSYTDSAISAGAVVLPKETKVKNGIPESLGISEFKFDDITFNRKGTYKFLVTESKDDQIADIVYSDAKFVVTKVVEDDGAGNLKVNKSLSYTTVLGSNEHVEIVFVNTPYTPGGIRLRAYKQLIGRKPAVGQFSFILMKDGELIDTASNDESGIALFKELNYKLSDLGDANSKTFTYTIKEVIPTGAKEVKRGNKTVYVLDGYTYDGHTETVNVLVEKHETNGNGYLTVEADNATETKQAWFRNEYEAYGKVDLDGTKAITGRKFTEKDNGVWQAVLYDSTGKELQRADITKETKIFGDKGAAFNFKSLEFKTKAELDPTQTDYVYDDYTTPKTFTYYVKEERNPNAGDNENTNGMKDDTVVYNVKITVSDDGKGHLIIPDPELTKADGSLVESLHFDNKFEADGSVNLEAHKKVTGTVLENKMFDFQLWGYDKDGELKVIQEKQNNSGGNVEFDAITYDQDSVREEPYEYVIKEYVKNSINGWTYSKAEYIARVWVSLDENNAIKTEKKYFRKNTDGSETEVDSAEVVFENTYVATGKVQPWAEKVFTGRDLPEDTFWFVLTDEYGTYTDRKSAPAAEAGKTATVLFDEIEYTLDDIKAADTYKVGDDTYEKYYFVWEEIPEGALDLGNGYYKKDGITYDGNRYKITVTLIDTKKGVIETDWKAAKNSEPLKDLTLWEKFKKLVGWDDVQKHALFTNTYDAEAAIDFNAFKVLKGKELGANKFEFVLSGKDTKGKDFESIKLNAADGTVSFDRITYTLDDVGEYTYQITEKIPDDAQEVQPGVFVKDGIWYDTGVYTIVVNVTDTKQGYLDIVAKIDGNSLTTMVEVEKDGKKVVKFDPKAFTFTNEYKPEPVVVTPGGRKDFQGGLLEDGMFEFKLVNDAGNPKGYEETVRNQGQWFTFPSIEFTAKDMEQGKVYASERTFAYTMTETIEDRPGVTYSQAEYKFVVKVTDNNGKLEAEVIRDDSYFKGVVPQNEIAVFYNTYDAEGTVSFPVRKIVEGTDDDKVFKFVLTDKQTNDKHELFLKGGEEGIIASFEYKLEDLEKDSSGNYIPRVYEYEVIEEAQNDEGGWEFCRDIYTSKVTVSDNKSGELQVDKKIWKNDAVYSDNVLEFINKYNAEGETDLKGHKELINGEELKGGEFTFILEEYKGVDPDTGKDIYEGVETATNDANGDFAFADRHYTLNDKNHTFKFRVKEDIPETYDPKKDKPIVYDETVYDVVIAISDNKDGTLKVDKKVYADGIEVKDCIFRFENTWVKPNEIVLTAEKDLEGLPLEDNMFTFTLEGTNIKKQEVHNNGTKVRFEAIHYDLSDAGKSFEYKVSETIENKYKNIVYDTTLYTVKVDVSRDGGNLVLDQKTYKNSAQIDNDDIKFINYWKSETTVPVGGSKILSGFPADAPSLGQYDYTFGLYDEDGNEIETATVTPKDANTPVEYKFNDLKFTEKDYNDPKHPDHIFKYTVKEKVPVLEKDKAPNVVYATNEYDVVVKLYVDNNKELKAEASTVQGVATDKLNFTNIYKADGSVVFPAVKTITGKELEDAAYTFTLTGEGQDQTVTNKGNQINFEPIQYTQNDLGLHTYTIKETASNDGSTIDSREYTAEVTVGEGSNGKLVVSGPVYYTIVDGQKVFVKAGEPITFENTYEAKGSIDIEGIKVMHSKPLAAGDFSFILKDENGKEVARVTHGAAKLNNKKDLEARAAFKFENISFDQEVLRSADGKSYLPEVKKYYTIEEEINHKGGVTYSNSAYVVELTIKDNGDKTLSVTKNVEGRTDVKKDDTDNGVSELLKALIGRMSGKTDDIVFENWYDSKCTIDPPVLIKEMFGLKLERGMFEFEITGPGLRSQNKSEYKVNVWNGINPIDGTDKFPNGKQMDIGEIYPGDVQYKFIDLDIDLETGAASKEFVYYAKEVDHSKDNPGVKFSDQILKLVVKVTDNNDGTLTVRNAKDLVVDGSDKDHKLFWQAVNPYTFEGEELDDTFMNPANQEGSIDIPGVKKMIGRALNKDDKFEFTITNEQGQSYTVNNTEDANGIPSRVDFKAKDKDGNIAIPFLNYRYGLYEKNPDRKADEKADLYKVDDTGNYVYTITETSVSSNNIKTDTATFKVYVEVKSSVKADGTLDVDKNGNGKLDVKITNVEKLYSDNNKVKFDFANNSVFEFTNEFKAAGSVSIEGTKYLQGSMNDADLTGKFGFVLYKYDDAARKTGKTLVDEKLTDKDGKFAMSIPEYDQEVLKNEKGEYETQKTLYYRLIEKKPSVGEWTNGNTVFVSNGVVYDNTEYDIDVTVTNDGTGTLKVEKDIKKAATGEAVKDIGFINMQNVEYTTISGNKIWVDDVTDESTRPDVKLTLYSSAVGNGTTPINYYTIKAPDKSYTFRTDLSGKELPLNDANGKAIKYHVTEEAIPGYVSEQNGYDFTNTRGKIVIQKLDANTGEPLSGATLAILDGSTEVEKWTSGKSAHVVKATLTPGKKYTLRELTAPAGYEVADDMTFTVPSDGSAITVTMEDKPIIGAVRLTKLDSATREKLSGAEFELYNDAGTRIYATGSTGKYKVTSSTSNGVFVVDASGYLEITDLPYGAYYFVEKKAPAGYVISSEKAGFTIAKAGETVEVTFLNKEAVGAVKLRKVSSSGSRTLEGAVFDLYAATPRSIGQAVTATIYPNGYYRYGTYTTNASGEIYVGDLPWDDYYFVEVQAPEGFKIKTDISGDPLVYTFKVDESTSGKTIDLGDIENEPEEEGGVLGERINNSGVLGVRSQPKKGVLGTRVGPATGDVSAIALWSALFLACAGTIVWLLRDRKKRRLN